MRKREGGGRCLVLVHGGDIGFATGVLGPNPSYTTADCDFGYLPLDNGAMTVHTMGRCEEPEDQAPQRTSDHVGKCFFALCYLFIYLLF